MIGRMLAGSPARPERRDLPDLAACAVLARSGRRDRAPTGRGHFVPPVSSIGARPWAAGAVLPSGSGAAGLLVDGDVEQGEVVLRKCYACDTVGPGECALTGRILFGVVGRAAARRGFHVLRGRSSGWRCRLPRMDRGRSGCLSQFARGLRARQRDHVRRVAGSKRARRYDRVSRGGAGTPCRGVRQCA
jgi:hypothetical protein